VSGRLGGWEAGKGAEAARMAVAVAVAASAEEAAARRAEVGPSIGRRGSGAVVAAAWRTSRMRRIGGDISGSVEREVSVK
jgi:hypothetical protein